MNLWRNGKLVAGASYELQDYNGNKTRNTKHETLNTKH